VFYADTHIHSRFSRACSKDSEVPSLAWWAARKGVNVAGTGDFAHPAWAQRLKESLVPAEPGLLRLRPELESRLRRSSPPSCHQEIRFLLSAEISTIYKREDATRKVHHLIYAPNFEAADTISAALAKVGNLASDGRPILGLDSRHLLEITLNAGPGCFLVPAHIWTPWFAVLGSKSGFDTVADCYGDLADHVFAVETGLSSDPPMNWQCSALDRYQLVSNSDAHSPPMLGREATAFSTALDYFAMADALRTGQGLAGTINFFPEGGRYHLDGHRKCGISFSPEDTISHGGMCPHCGKPLTIGVLHRVAELADRPIGHRPAGAPGYANLVSLPEIVGEIHGVGAKSKNVTATVDRLVATLGPELRILRHCDVADISRAGGSLLGEAIGRLRRGAVIKQAGYDGEYGVIRLFRPEELARAGALFDMPAPSVPAINNSAKRLAIPNPPNLTTPQGVASHQPGQRGASGPETGAPGSRESLGPDERDEPWPTGTGNQPGSVARPQEAGQGGLAAAAVWHEKEPVGGSVLAGLDPDQRAAAESAGPLMIIAGPGTGKTRTLTRRIASQVAEHGAPPESCLALTFTRRAATEMRERLASLIPGQAGRLMVTTFHGLGLAILREHGWPLAGLTAGFTVADEKARLAVAAEETGSEAEARRLLAAEATDPAVRARLAKALSARDMVDFDGLIEIPLALLRDRPALAASLRERWPRVSVDEYQDIDASQYALVRLLAGDGAGLTVIGDPDQAIYGFRGADVSFFLRFGQDYPGARTVQLTRNYRSSPAIVAGALQAVAPSTLVPGRILQAVAAEGGGDGARPGGARGSGAGPAGADRSGAGPGGAGRSGGWDGAGQDVAAAAARIMVYEAADEQAEAAWIAATIDRVLGGTSFHSLDSGRADGNAGGRTGLADIAVLYRIDAQAGPLIQGLTRAGLPSQKRSHDLLARRTVVPEIVREMRLAQGAGPDGSVAERLALAVRRLAARVPGGPGGGEARGGEPGAAWSAVDVLAAGEVLAPLAHRSRNDLERFFTEIALGAEVDALDPRADAIALLTLHAAKGLEFNAVFLAGCERGLLPLWLPGAGKRTVPGPGTQDATALLARNPVPDPAEERRLLFVGMTRARTHLFLTCAGRRRRHGIVADSGPSPFLASIDPALLDRPARAQPRRPAERQLRLL
jgi:DNA helicase-2/ATP-dependent DNA helicase PcrA